MEKDDRTDDGMSQFTNTTTTDDVSYNSIFESGPHSHHGVIEFLLHSPKGLTVLLGSASLTFIIMFGIIVCFCIKCLRRRKKEDSMSATTVYSTPSSFESHQRGEIGGTGNPGKVRIIPHTNVITPDRTIAFVVPTVPLHAQAKSRESFPCLLSSTRNEPSTSSSSTILRASSVIPPMFETQFFPQFHFEESLGPQIGFSLSYDCGNQRLLVRILGGCNFPEDSGLSYSVHVKLYPGRGSKQRTKEFDGSNPLYNQEFTFHVRGSVLQTKILKFRVIGSTPGVIGTRSLLGVVNMAMKEIPIVSHSEVTTDFRTGQMWIELDHPLNVGEGVRLDVSLKWSNDPTPGLLVLKIREAQGLHEITEAEYTTTYVKVTLQEEGKNIKSKKTRPIRWGSLPNYDDTFVVTVPFELLMQVSFVLTLLARGRLGSKTILGKINIGPIPNVHQPSPLSRSSLKSGNEIWEDMIHQPNVEVTRWLQLQP